MLRDKIIAHLGEDWDKLLALMSDSLETDIPLLRAVNMGVLEHSGKMLRPMLTLLSARMLAGEINEDVLRFAVATELLHNATLLHDDVADESPVRRGAPTLNASFGPTAAVLVGDFWLARAMEVAMVTTYKEKLVKVFSKVMANLAEGEMLQLQKASGEDTREEDYFRIIYCKTASLFEAAAISGVISIGAGQEQSGKMGEYAKSLGIAFQIKDDILDYVGDTALGKPVGIDLKESKVTLPLLCALKDSPREREIRSKVFRISSHPEYFDEIIDFVKQNRGVEKAEAVLEGYVDKSLEALEYFAPGEDRDFLAALAKYNSKREF